jgi:hypothetical protein
LHDGLLANPQSRARLRYTGATMWRHTTRAITLGIVWAACAGTESRNATAPTEPSAASEATGSPAASANPAESAPAASVANGPAPGDSASRGATAPTPPGGQAAEPRPSRKTGHTLARLARPQGSRTVDARRRDRARGWALGTRFGRLHFTPAQTTLQVPRQGRSGSDTIEGGATARCRAAAGNAAVRDAAVRDAAEMLAGEG